MKNGKRIKAEMDRLRGLELQYMLAGANCSTTRDDNIEQAVRANVAARKLAWVLEEGE